MDFDYEYFTETDYGLIEPLNLDQLFNECNQPEDDEQQEQPPERQRMLRRKRIHPNSKYYQPFNNDQLVLVEYAAATKSTISSLSLGNGLVVIRAIDYDILKTNCAGYDTRIQSIVVQQGDSWSSEINSFIGQLLTTLNNRF